jgi:hypothetical protein
MERHMRGSRFVVVLSAVVAVAWFGGTARAGFVNGIEKFDGTTLDPATWRMTSGGNAGVVQNGALTLFTTGPALANVDYTATTWAIHIGGSVEADLSFSPGAGVIEFGIRTLTAPTAATGNHKFRIALNTPDANAFHLSPQGSGPGQIFGFSGGSGYVASPNLPYHASVARISPTLYGYSLRTPDRGEFTGAIQAREAVTEDMFVYLRFLNQGSDSVTFDNVRLNGEVASVPLPAAAPAAGVLLSAMVGSQAWRARRRRRAVANG